MNYYVLCRTEKSGGDFLARHPELKGCSELICDTTAFHTFFHTLLDTAKEDYICILHDDVYLGPTFKQRAESLVSTLHENHPSWGLAGNCGRIPFRVGYGANDLVRYITDPEEGPNLTGAILPGECIDGCVMLLNLQAIREKDISLPEFTEFRFYSYLLGWESLKAGLAVLICPHLACYHDGKDDLHGFLSFIESPELQKYFQSNIKNNYVNTIHGTVLLDVSDNKHQSPLDIPLASLQNAVNKQKRRQVAIVTRSTLNRPHLLERTIESAHPFVLHSDNELAFEHYVILDTRFSVNIYQSSGLSNKNVTILQPDIPESVTDSRFFLIKHAIENIQADYFWFVDDDDWFISNDVTWLSLVLKTIPPKSMVVTDTRHFIEKALASDMNNIVTQYSSSPGPRFRAIDLMNLLSGYNSLCLCQTIFPRSALCAIPESAYRNITYGEDYLIAMSTILQGTSLPVMIEKMYTGVSIRDSGNTVTEKDRSTWNRMFGENTYHFSNFPGAVQLLSIPRDSSDNTHCIANLREIANKRKLQLKLLLYRVLSSVTFGSLQKCYSAKKEKAKVQLRQNQRLS